MVSPFDDDDDDDDDNDGDDADDDYDDDEHGAEIFFRNLVRVVAVDFVKKNRRNRSHPRDF